MTDLGKLLADFTPGAYGIWAIALMVASFWLKEWRETRKLSLEDRLARRDGYAKQVENLQSENRALLGDVHKLREDHDNYRRLCQQETDALRNYVLRLENDIMGLRRRVDTASIEAIRMSPTFRRDDDET